MERHIGKITSLHRRRHTRDRYPNHNRTNKVKATQENYFIVRRSMQENEGAEGGPPVYYNNVKF
jgi:hypothetical protein